MELIRLPKPPASRPGPYHPCGQSRDRQPLDGLLFADPMLGGVLLHKRPFLADQRYLIWKRVNEGSEVWQAERQRNQDEANRKRSEATKQQPRTEDGTRLAEKESGRATSCGTTRRKQPNRLPPLSSLQL